MKKIILLCITICLLGCNSIPIIDGETPFVVKEIKEVGSGMSMYTAEKYVGYDVPGNPHIVLPTGLYNIGDTISFINK